MAGARWATQIREQKRDSRNRPKSIQVISMWYRWHFCMVGKRASYSLSRLSRLRPVQNLWPSTVINIGLVSKAGHPLSRLLCVLVGIRGKGPWWGVGGSRGGCFRVRQSSGPSRREETFLPAHLQRWVILQPQGSLNGLPALLSPVEGRQTCWA